MEQSDLDILRAGYDAFVRREIELLLDCVHPELELHTYGEGTFRGHRGLLRWIATMDEGYEEWGVDVEEILDWGPRAIVVAVLHGRSRINKIENSQRFFIVWEVRDGKAAVGRHLIDMDSAREWAQAPLRTASIGEG
jgi:ketosteroid isomerase-like protein